MLGYVKTEPGEMLVKQYGLYKAIYCGLCDSVRKSASRFLSPFLSYDFVFLAAVRMAVLNEKPLVLKKRCVVHPFRKRAYLAESVTLSYVAEAEMILVYEKMRDDVFDCDVSFLRRVFLKGYSAILKKKIEKVTARKAELAALSEFVFTGMAEGRKREKEGAQLDEMCSAFGEVLSAITSYGTCGEEQRILARVGEMLGRFLYTLDALDDLEKDEKSGSFNPLLQKYSTAAKARESAPQIDLVLAWYIQEMKLAFELSRGDADICAIVENILNFGLKSATKKAANPIETHKGRCVRRAEAN